MPTKKSKITSSNKVQNKTNKVLETTPEKLIGNHENNNDDSLFGSCKTDSQEDLLAEEMTKNENDKENEDAARKQGQKDKKNKKCKNRQSNQNIPTFELCRLCYRPAFSNLGLGNLIRCCPSTSNIVDNLPDITLKTNLLERDLAYLFKNFRTAHLELLPPADELPLIGTKNNHLNFNNVLDENNLIVVHKSCAEWSSGAKKIDGNDDKIEFKNIDIIIKASLNQICIVCEKYGASVFCDKCNTAYHFPCCVAEGCFLMTDAGSAEHDQVKNIMICANCVDNIDNLVIEEGLNCGIGPINFMSKSDYLAKKLHLQDDETNIFIDQKISDKINFKLVEFYLPQNQDAVISNDDTSHINQMSMDLLNLTDHESFAYAQSHGILDKRGKNASKLQVDSEDFESTKKSVNEKSVRELKGYMYCVTCGTNYYGSVLDIIPSRINRAGWQCPNCKVCQGCQTNTRIEEMIICDKCDNGFHLDCLNPVLTQEEAENEEWICPNCDSGGSRTVVYAKSIKESYLQNEPEASPDSTENPNSDHLPDNNKVDKTIKNRINKIKIERENLIKSMTKPKSINFYVPDIYNNPENDRKLAEDLKQVLTRNVVTNERKPIDRKENNRRSKKQKDKKNEEEEKDEKEDHDEPTNLTSRRGNVNLESIKFDDFNNNDNNNINNGHKEQNANRSNRSLALIDNKKLNLALEKLYRQQQQNNNNSQINENDNKTVDAEPKKERDSEFSSPDELTVPNYKNEIRSVDLLSTNYSSMLYPLLREKYRSKKRIMGQMPLILVVLGVWFLFILSVKYHLLNK